MSDFFKVGVEVELTSPNDFLKTKETLERIGIASMKDGKKVLNQSCHILHKKGRYAIVHFLEMFILDGKESKFNDDDRYRRDTIALMLDDWGLIKINPVDKDRIENEEERKIKLKIIPHKEKSSWVLRSLYHIGKAK